MPSSNELAKRSITSFLKKSTCFDVVPNSHRVLVLDERISLLAAFQAFVEEDLEQRSSYYKNQSPKGDIHAAALWNANLNTITGTLTATDLAMILKHAARINSTSSIKRELKDLFEHHSIGSWKYFLLTNCNLNHLVTLKEDSMQDDNNYTTGSIDPAEMSTPGYTTIRKIVEHYSEKQIQASNSNTSMFNRNINIFGGASNKEKEPQAADQLECRFGFGVTGRGEVLKVSPETSLYQACCLIQNAKASAIPIYDSKKAAVLGVLTHLSILRYFLVYYKEDRRIFDNPIKSLQIHKNGVEVKCATANMNIKQVLELDVDPVPVVDDKERPIGLFYIDDLLNKASKDFVEDTLFLPIGDFLFMDKASIYPAPHSDVLLVNNLFLCKENDGLIDIFVKFAEAQVTTLVCVDNTGKFEGLVSLSDMLSFFTGNNL